MIFEKMVWGKEYYFWEYFFPGKIMDNLKKVFGKFLWKISWVFLFEKIWKKKSHDFYGERGVCIKSIFLEKLVLNKKDFKKMFMGFILFFLILGSKNPMIFYENEYFF